MPNTFPCPNPTCSHVFPPEAVRGTAVLACPRCGSTFQFRPAGAKPAPPARPAKRPAAKGAPPAPPSPAVPATAVTPPAPVPLAMPVAEPAAPAEDPHAALAPPPDFVAPHLARHRGSRRRGIAPYVFLGVAAVLLVAFGVVGWLARGWLFPGNPTADNEPAPGGVHESRMYNYRFQYPPAPWKLDAPTKLGLRTNMAFRRTDPNAWLALLTADYKDRTPTDAEMVDEGVRRLKAYFKDSLEWEQKPDGELAGRRAQRLEFVGQVNSVDVSGAAYLLAYNGVGYWFVTWAPTASKDVVADDWDALRAGFALGKEREGWAVKPPKQLTLTGAKAPYTLRYVEGVWEKQDDPSAYDADADRALLGHDQAEPQDADKNGTALVLLLPGQEGLKAAVRAARDHLLAQEKKLYPECTLEEADAKPPAGDRPPDRVGNRDGRVVKLRLKIPDANDHFVYLAVVPGPGHVLVVQCECDLRRRVYWEVNFTQLVRELRLKEG